MKGKDSQHSWYIICTNQTYIKEKVQVFRTKFSFFSSKLVKLQFPMGKTLNVSEKKNSMRKKFSSDLKISSVANFRTRRRSKREKANSKERKINLKLLCVDFLNLKQSFSQCVIFKERFGNNCTYFEE